MGWDGMGFLCRTSVGWDRMGWDGMGWDGLDWIGLDWIFTEDIRWMGWDGMGWIGLDWIGLDIYGGHPLRGAPLSAHQTQESVRLGVSVISIHTYTLPLTGCCLSV